MDKVYIFVEETYKDKYDYNVNIHYDGMKVFDSFDKAYEWCKKRAAEEWTKYEKYDPYTLQWFNTDMPEKEYPEDGSWRYEYYHYEYYNYEGDYTDIGTYYIIETEVF